MTSVKGMTNNELERELARMQALVAELEAENEALKAGRIPPVLWRQIVEGSTEATAVIGADGKYIEQNDAHRALLGFDDSELIGRTPAIHLGDEGFSRVVDRLRASGSFGGQVKSRSKDGRELVVHLTSFAITDEEGRPVGYVGLKRDVTAQKILEDEIEFRKSSLESLIRHSPLAIASLDADHKVIDCNSKFEELFGFDRNSIEGRRLDSLIAGEKLDEAVGFTEHTISGEPMSAVTTRYHKDGTPVEVEVFGVPIIVDNEVVGAYGIYHDVSEQKRAEAALETERTTLDNIITLNPYGIAIFDSKGTYKRGNQAFIEMFGQPPLPEYSVFDDPVLKRMGIDHVLRRVQGGESVDVGHFWYDPTEANPDVPGRKVCIEGAVFPVESPWGDVDMVIMFEDVTERVTAEERLRESEEKFRVLIEAAFEGIMVHDQGRLLEVNPRATDMFGYAAAEMISMPILDLIAAEHREIVQRQIDLAHEEAIEVRARRGDGSTFPVEIVGKAFSYAGRQVQVAAVRDLTERKNAEEALRTSEERYRNLVEDSFDGIFVQRGTEIIFANRRLHEMLGYDYGRLIGLDHWRVYHPDYQDITRERAQSRMRGETPPPRYEVKLMHRDGSSFDGEISSRAIDIEGSPGVQVWIRDITERKRAEEQLLGERERLFSILQKVPYGVVMTDGDGRYVYINEGFTNITGYTLEDVPDGRTFFEKAYPDLKYRRRTVEAWKRDVVKGMSNRTFVIRCKDGSKKDIEFRPISLPDGGAIVTLYDFTERRRAEETLRQSEERFRSLAENSPDIIYTLDAIGAFAYVNTAWQNILGYSNTEVLGKYFVDYAEPQNAREYVRIFKKITQDKETVRRHDGTLIHKDGTLRLFSMSGAPNLDAEGNVIGMVGLCKDITTQHKLETELQHTKRIEAVGTLTGGISHDFNNILQAIMGYTQLLLSRRLEDVERDRYLELIIRSVERGSDLVRQLLTFSRKAESRLRPVDLNHEIVQVLQMLERTIPRMISIESRLADDIWPVLADPTQMEQILMNLGINARDAMPEGGRLVVETKNVRLGRSFVQTHLGSKPGKYVLLRVWDTGLGMDEETLDHIFEPFFTTKSFGEGTGLGLSTVYGIVKSHGGYIACESEPGGGAVFSIYLPVYEARADRSVTEEAEPAEIPGGNECILLVDDEPAILDVGQNYLCDFGYRTLAAKNGEEAVKVFEAEGDRIDLVILDLSMPGMGGHKCLTHLKKIDSGVKVLIASGYSAAGQAKEAIRAGAAGFIPKPYRLTDLVAKVREMLDL